MTKNIFFSNDNEKLQIFDWGEVLWLHEPSNVENQHLSAAMVKILSKSKHTRHFHFGEEQLLYVLKGKGLNKVNDEEKNIYEGMILHCPPYSEHEIINAEETELIILIVYTPSKIEEIHQSLSIIPKDHMLENIDLEILENVQKEISNLLNLSIVVTDKFNKKITKSTYLNSFCILCSKEKLCEEASGIFICDYKVITLSIPIIVNGEIIGYVKCGHLLINRLKDIEKKLLEIAKEENLEYEKILEAYKTLPVVPKSRLYALTEYFKIVSKYITGMIINSMIEKELSEKNNQILEKTQEKMYLENALKQANLKILKTQVTANIKAPINGGELFANTKKIEYPFSSEIELENNMKALDKTKSIHIIQSILKNYEEGNVPFVKVKNIMDELIGIISRVIYRETNNIELMSEIREKYKELNLYSKNYENLTECSIKFVAESIDIIRGVLLNGASNLIEKVNIYINENCFKDLTLNSISEVFYISPNYLSTIFNEKNKISLTDYINKIRIEKAKEYLKSTDLKISEISKMVGYKNVSYFGYMFKKYIKATPKQYRLENKNLQML